MKFKKLYLKQIQTLQIHVQVVPTVVPFVLIVPDQINKVRKQIKTKILRTQTTTKNILTTKTLDTKLVVISKATDIKIIAVHQTSNKTETTQTNNQEVIVTKQITSTGIVKPVLITEDCAKCLANVEHHDRIRTIGNKI